MDPILNAKREEAKWTIIKASIRTGIVSTIPTPGFEVIKLTASDFEMFYDIYKTYLKEDISQEDVLTKFADFGWVAVSSGAGGLAGAYITVRVTQGMVNEVGNFFGPHAWIATGVASGAMTVFVGAVWTIVVEHQYLLRHGRLDESFAFAAISSGMKVASEIATEAIGAGVETGRALAPVCGLPTATAAGVAVAAGTAFVSANDALLGLPPNTTGTTVRGTVKVLTGFSSLFS